ncbi:MAG: YkgJ family cysteine cluster protein [Flavobacterium sp.]
MTLPKITKKELEVTKKFLQKLKQKPPKDLDYTMQELHDEEFEKTDCMQCANCCKTTSPIFTEIDVERIAKYLKMKYVDFVKEYLIVDEDNFMVLQQAPCSFLNDDNSCNIYNVRPKACKEYPHTNRKKFYQINQLTMKNIELCPAAFNIVEKMKEKIKVSK